MFASLLQVLANLLLFVGPNLGLGWWLARRAPLGTVERLWLAWVAGIVITGSWVFLGYALRAPVRQRGPGLLAYAANGDPPPA